MALNPADLTLIHLSDIHFREDDGTLSDRNRDLRTMLQNDLRRQLRKVVRYDGIAVTGDVGFSGKRNEYDIATEWLETVCEEIGCPAEAVLPTPGNHDVNRDDVTDEIRAIHRKLRSCERRDINDQIRTLLKTGEVEKLLIPIRNYNAFASQYKCELSPDRLYWERDFLLSGGITLRFRGLNSACISNDEDNEDANRLILSEFQTQLVEQSGVQYVTLGHHPPSWLRDQDEADSYFNQRSRLQLFGHKHEQTILPIGQSVRIVAGATHPDRREPEWEPRYNIVQFRVVDGRRATLKIVVTPRRWSKEAKGFVADPGLDDWV